MNWREEWKKAAWLLALFTLCYTLPIDGIREWARLKNALWESAYLVQWYAQEHVILCLLPAFFIAGAVGVFASQASIMKYLGAKANKFLAYGVAAVSGTALAVCSCTVLPLFAGIYRMGAGLGPACAFLYSGPAINLLAIVLTARILGFEMGLARAVGAVSLSIVIGLSMHFIFRKEELAKANAQAKMPEPKPTRPLWQNAFLLAIMTGILVFSNWGQPSEAEGLWQVIYSSKWILTSLLSFILALVLMKWFGLPKYKVILSIALTTLSAMVFSHEPVIPFTVAIIGLSWVTSTSRGENQEWFFQSWTFAKQIMPLLLAGVFVAGLLLGRPSGEGLIPAEWVNQTVGGNSIYANLFASVLGAFMYFATLTEVPILQGLIGAGMGKGPALSLLLAGPALSLPNMLVIRSVMGTKKTIVFILLVIGFSTLGGWGYGWIVGPS